MEYSCKLAGLIEKKASRSKWFYETCERIFYLSTKRKRTLPEDNEKFWLWHRLEREL